MILAEKRAIVTGASIGLGFEIARAFVRNGAHVIICSRTEGDLEKAREALAEETVGTAQKIIAIPADVSSVHDVERLESTASQHFGGLDILVCNAGVYGPKGAFAEGDWDSWVRAVNINVLGTALPCKILTPLLRKSRRGKVLILSGGGATKPLKNLSAYATSKAAIVRFGETLALEVASSNIDVNMISPGALNTRLLDEILDAGPARVGEEFYEASKKQKMSGGTPLQKGADLCVFLASEESDGISGRLISAVWDPWQRFAELRADIQGSDVYTLRRIIPEERGFKWD